MAPDCKVFTQNAGGAAIVAPEQGTSVAVSRREEKRYRRGGEGGGGGGGGVKKGDLADFSPAFRSLPRGAQMYTHSPHTATRVSSAQTHHQTRQFCCHSALARPAALLPLGPWLLRSFSLLIPL